MKTIITLFSLLISLSTFAGPRADLITVEGFLDSGYDITEVKGKLKDLKELHGEIDGGEGDFSFELSNFSEDHLTSAKKIARYIFAVVFEGLNTKEPWPCGGVSDGDVSERYLQRGTYTIGGEGDGYYDTCTGEGGPGAWSAAVTVTFDSKKKKGKFNISWYVE